MLSLRDDAISLYHREVQQLQVRQFVKTVREAGTKMQRADIV